MRLLWYFAYGRNVNPVILVNRINASPLALHRGLLPGYRLEFTKTPASPQGIGYATIKPATKEWVEGVLYLLTGNQLRILDRHEGVPEHYTRGSINVWDIDVGCWVKAVTYIATRTNPKLKPSRSYIECILEGARLVHLSREWILRLEEFLREAI